MSRTIGGRISRFFRYSVITDETSALCANTSAFRKNCSAFCYWLSAFCLPKSRSFSLKFSLCASFVPYPTDAFARLLNETVLRRPAQTLPLRTQILVHPVANF